MTTEPEKKPRMRRSVRILLIVSLAMNLIVVGLVLGAALGHGGRGGPGSIPEDGPGSPIARAMSWEDRRDIGKSIRKAHRRFTEDGPSNDAVYEALVEALISDPYDADAMDEARKLLDTSNWERRRIAHDIWLRHVGKMSLERRQEYAESLQEVLEQRQKSKHRKNNADQ